MHFAQCCICLLKGDLFIALCREGLIMRNRQEGSELRPIYRGTVSVFLCDNLMMDEQRNKKDNLTRQNLYWDGIVKIEYQTVENAVL